VTFPGPARGGIESTTRGSCRLSSAASSARPRPGAVRRVYGAVYRRRAGRVHIGQGNAGVTSLIGTWTVNAPHSSHRNSYDAMTPPEALPAESRARSRNGQGCPSSQATTPADRSWTGHSGPRSRGSSSPGRRGSSGGWRRANGCAELSVTTRRFARSSYLIQPHLPCSALTAPCIRRSVNPALLGRPVAPLEVRHGRLRPPLRRTRRHGGRPRSAPPPPSCRLRRGTASPPPATPRSRSGCATAGPASTAMPVNRRHP
jgi:hypothetical protein